MTTLKEEEPYAAAVDTEFISSTCSKCFAWNSKDIHRVKLSRCAGCLKLYYCSAKCQKDDWKDHKHECKRLRNADFLPSGTARLVMRMLDKSKKHPEFKAYNGRTYDSLMTHAEKRRQSLRCLTEAGTTCCEIFSVMGTDVPDFETVFLALCKKAINAFTIRDGTLECNPRGTGIYLGLSALDHSCRPDAFVINQGSKMLLKTTKKDLVYSDKLTISYTSGHFFLDTVMRREQLVNSLFFYCECEECNDIEADQKRTSGRPSCCPDSWFSIEDLVCNNCKQEVSSELKDKAEDAMNRIYDALLAFKREHEGNLFLWMNLFDNLNGFDEKGGCKQFLSDENALLFAVANLIYVNLPPDEVKVALRYVDLCLPHARKRLDSLYSTTLLINRHRCLEILEKPLQERKEALNEAIDAAQVFFGPEHDITQLLLFKKMLYDLESLKTTN